MQAKCFLLCLLQRYQMIDKSGAFHRDKVDRFFLSQRGTPVITSLPTFLDGSSCSTVLTPLDLAIYPIKMAHFPSLVESLLFPELLSDVMKRKLILAQFLFMYNSDSAQSYDYSRKASSFKTNFMESSKHCSNIYNTSLVDILPLFARSDIGNMQAKCFLLCLLQRYQMIDKSGAFHRDKVDRFLDSMPDSKFKFSLKSFKDKCLKEDSQNQCQKAYKFSACFYNNNVDKKYG